MNRLVAVAAAVAATGLLAVAGAAPADAATTTPTGLHVVGVTSTSFTVAVRPVAGAHAYRVYASTLKSDVYVDNIGKATSRRHSATATAPEIKLAHLTYTSAPYYYRVEALVGHRHRWSSTWPTVGLRPSAPHGLAGTSGTSGTTLRWAGVYSTGSQVEQATDSAFTTGRVTYRTQQSGRHFTPYAVSAEHSYYFRVRSANLSTLSPASAPIRVTIASRTQGIRVLTYNSLSAGFDGTREGSGVVGSWSARLPGQVALLKASAADVIGIQEGLGCVIRYKAKPCWRQVDSLAKNLGRGYALADTDNLPDVNRFAGNYIIYRTSRLTPVGTGGHMPTGDGGHAAYQVFRAKTTGATFLFMTTHLPAPRGTKYDRERGTEAAAMVKGGEAYARRVGVSSIVYSGDFNSYPHRYQSVDKSGAEMSAAGTSDAIQVAQHVSNARYNSINQYLRTPPQHDGSADHVYVSPGVGVQSWREMLTLKGGKFVGTIPSDHNPVYAWIDLPY